MHKITVILNIAQGLQPSQSNSHPCPISGVTEDIRNGGKIGRGGHLRCHTDELGLQVGGSTWKRKRALLSVPLSGQERRKRLPQLG